MIWTITTERDREGTRRGITDKGLTETLLHLARRGDRYCWLVVEEDGALRPSERIDLQAILHPETVA